MRVVHVNDVAGVGSAAVEQARSEGLDWRLWPLPGGRAQPMPAKVYRRAIDLARFRRAGRSADMLHVHFGLFGYYAWSVRRPYVLHLHGTDVRSTLTRRYLGSMVMRSIRRAGHVVYSTPDLAALVRDLRPDATWIPAPVSPSLCGPTPPDVVADRRESGQRVVFSSRWDPVKGTETMLDLAAALRTRRPEVELVGIDWGQDVTRARAAGVRLLPLLPPTAFRSLLAGADVVVGQQADRPLVVVADLEAMALARPVVARYTAAEFYGEDAPVWNTAVLDPVGAVEAILDDPDGAAARADAGRPWVLRHHSAAAFVRRVQPLYQDLAAA
jgi:glycosyltransferase involved in cell wall biosynthesis